jgi:quercetin dioxygenase-like cupin family protein
MGGMKPVVKQAASLEARPVERGEKAFIQVLIGPEDGAPHFILRKFTLLPGGRIPKHKHPTIEHEQYVLSGRMKVLLGDEVREVQAGQAVFIPRRPPTPTSTRARSRGVPLHHPQDQRLRHGVAGVRFRP